MTKTILAFSDLDGMAASQLKELEEQFKFIKLYQEPEPEKAIQDHRSDIVAIMCHPGQKISRNLMEKLPNLEFPLKIKAIYT